MRHVSKISVRGFTLLEVTISMVLGLIVLGAAVQLYSRAVSATWFATERAQMQQDIRASADLMQRDISLAGAGLPPGGLALPTGGGNIPRYGCDISNTCHIGGVTPAGVAFPNNYLTWVVPGFQMGPTLNPAAGPTDVITVVYADTNFPLNCYNVTFNNPNGTAVTFTNPAAPLPNCSATPTPVTSAINGLIPGDVVFFRNTTGGQTGLAVANVSSAAGAASPYAVGFANGDILWLNQTAATAGDIKQISGGVGTSASRVFIITYYIDTTTGTPRLMREVNAQPPIPVTENVSDLRFTYDTYDTNGNLQTGVGDAGISLGVSPNMIRKINVKHLTFRSPLAGTTGYQGFDIQTSISARNMSFSNRYQ